ncbi:acetylglutamate kinase [Hydrogenobaculum acidophilum]
MENLLEKASILQEALPFIRDFYGKIFVVKYGGAAMEEEELKHSFAKDIALLRYVGIKVVLVHGGGKDITNMLNRLNIQTEFINGIRKTDQESLDIARMVLIGKLNKDIVAMLNKEMSNMHGAIGLSGVDGNLLVCTKYYQDNKDIGFVGKVKAVNTKLIRELIQNDYTPVIAPIGIEPETTQMYNINADMAATEIACELGAEKLIFLTDTDGILDKNGRTISSIQKTQYKELIEDGTITKGMIPKITSAVDAILRGVRKVHIINGKIKHSILIEVFTKEGIGTEISL